MNKLFENLNEQQLIAVKTTDTPLRIIAGAGSGKTRVITAKIAYLINEKNIFPRKILAMTFTNKAANEMKERIKKMLDNENVNPFISTFHAFCARVLREECEAIGLHNKFSILDSNDQRAIIRKIIKNMKLNEDGTLNRFDKKALSKISFWKNELTEPDEALDICKDIEEKAFAKIYKKYQQHLFEQNLVDFDDLQILVYKIFRDNKDILQKWRNRFDYVMVDEFQDTNEIQFDLIKLLTAGKNNLTVVGDPDQTIYSWRGAKIQIIMQFHQVYPNAVTVVLNENYRSTQQILNLANDLIEHNKHREPKSIFTNNDHGPKPKLKEFSTRYGEARFVAHEIKKLVEEQGYQYGDMFILYRMNAWSQEFEKTLDNAKIPYNLIGSIKFRERKVIKDSIALLKSISICDDLSVERVLKFTPKVGDVTIEKIYNLASEKQLSLFELMIDEENSVRTITKYLDPIRNTFIKARVMFENNESLVELMKFLVKESEYEAIVKRLDDKDRDEWKNVEALYDQLKNFEKGFNSELYGEENVTLAFLQEESLASEEADEEKSNRVSLLTIHSAKGLENKVVFVVGLNRDVFPSKNSMLTIAEFEEERRALYVALTRAKEILYISYIKGEYSHLSGGALIESKFVKELNPDLYTYESNIFVKQEGKSGSYLKKVFGEKPEIEVIKTDINENDLVNHVMFGDGIVIKKMDRQLQIQFTDSRYGSMILASDNPVLTKK
ncbi:ATP-dependent DNA helicase [Williamsoniiplasma luminosum]|uniref:DNA 3'-5' helicase n=1 Tax=Williamsoniiplasma luminosum TaxID=214888 RepID=A0A2K8NSJ2_9MOLU|nr:UvrD-helicase domain-containing protein [Williamsoniiplasma luminosum]ATZ16769.1 ATP-dependent DNA helicase [Williamsoniiplasma luminosum]